MYCGKTLTGLQSLFSFADEQQTCAGIVKPDIVFFGESLPSDFFDGFSTIAHADLVIVMGTSLKVSTCKIVIMVK